MLRIYHSRLIFVLALCEMPDSWFQTSSMQPPNHLKGYFMFCCQRLFQGKENNAAGRAGDLCFYLCRERVKDHAQLLTILHFLSRLHKTAENAARRGKHIGHLIFLHDRRQIPTLEEAFRQTVPSVIVVPVDYSENMKLSAHLKEVYRQSGE